MTNPPAPDPELLEEFSSWLFTQGKSKNTIKGYSTILRTIPKDIDAYFSNQNIKSRKLRFVAYRSYLRFLAIKKKIIDRSTLMDYLDTYKPPKQRGNGTNILLYSISKSKWVQYIKFAPNQVAKMGIWIGFHFGLRLGEILHLRIDDINFRQKNILIREHNKTADQDAWRPKYNRQRSVPFTVDQSNTLKRWITENRSKDLKHNYLLWNERGKRKKKRVLSKCFEDWCAIAGRELDSRKFKPHIMRYSFATHYYEATKDIKLISDLLGHANVSTTSEYLRLGQKETENKARAAFEKY